LKRNRITKIVLPINPSATTAFVAETAHWFLFCQISA
jgi:hypothetical protein